MSLRENSLILSGNCSWVVGGGEANQRDIFEKSTGRRNKTLISYSKRSNKFIP